MNEEIKVSQEEIDQFPQAPEPPVVAEDNTDHPDVDPATVAPKEEEK